jgi:hypothetical protein
VLLTNPSHWYLLPTNSQAVPENLDSLGDTLSMVPECTMSLIAEHGFGAIKPSMDS